MHLQWIKLSPRYLTIQKYHGHMKSLSKGISIINSLEDIKFEQFLCRIVSKIKFQDKDIFTEEEKQKLTKIFNVDVDSLMLVIKTVLYIYKKLLKFIFVPGNLKTDLNTMGFSEDKAETIMKIWSNEARTALNNCRLDNNIESCDKDLKLMWNVNAELSSEYQKKTKTPKAYLTLSGTEIEFTHTELHNMYLQLELLQNDIDNVMQ